MRSLYIKKDVRKITFITSDFKGPQCVFLCTNKLSFFPYCFCIVRLKKKILTKNGIVAEGFASLT